ncbi:MAG: TonB-dependent receptor plug domain-containing protein [Pseudohongiellaceae bacterium]
MYFPFRFGSGLLSGAIFCSLCSAAFGQNIAAPPDVGEIVVIANRVPVPLRQIGAAVTVIEADDIEAHGNFNLHNILRQSVAVGGSSNGGIGSTSTLRIRGEEGFRTLLVFDGLKMADPSAPQVAPSLEHILTSGVGRVEILRGPQGLSYGADTGGVIRIDSRRGADSMSGQYDNDNGDNRPTRFNLEGQGGSRDTTQLSAGLSVAGERGDAFIAATKFATDGYNVRTSDTVLMDNDGYDNNSFHGRVSYQFSNAWHGELVHRQVDAETDYDGCFNAAFAMVHDCQALYDLQASRLAVEYNANGFSHALAWSGTDTKREDYADGALSFDDEGMLRRLEYIGSATELPGVDLIFGVDLEQEDSGSAKRDNRGYYVEALSDFSERLFLSVGVRRDGNDDFGNHTSYRLSATRLWQTAGGQLKLKGSYGTGFRAPSLFEVAYNAGPFASAPAAGIKLKEEISRGLEYGFEYQSKAGTRLELVVFKQKVEDAIAYDLAGNSGYLQDIGVSTSDGVEFALEYPLNSQWSLSANFTWNDTERPDGSQRIRRPEKLANLGSSYRSTSGRFHFSGFYRVSRDAVDEVFGAPVPLDDFEVLDITAGYRISNRLEFFARIENALDESYREVIGFRTPSRASYLGIKAYL